jgi:hypothetical protein
MKKIIIALVAVVSLAGMSGCEKGIFNVDDSTIDPNLVAEEVVLANPSKTQIIQLCKGLESAMRNGYNDFIASTGAVGREVVSSRSTDNRYYTELLGTDVANFSGANDPAGIFNAYYAAFSATRRRAELLARTANNATSITAGEKKAVEGFARTIQAYVTLNLLNMQGKNGIRETFSDLNKPGDLLKPGKFGTYTTGLAVVKKYVDDGLDALNAGTNFPFTFGSGFAGFNTVTTFKQFNRAVAARIALYQADWNALPAILNASFMNLNGPLTAGPKYVWSTAANDLSNTLFVTPNNTGSPYVVFNDVIAAVEPGDTRFTGASAKAQPRTTPRQSGAFLSTHEVRIFANNVSPSSIIKNEELILIWAEAKAELNTPGTLAEAVTAINYIRTSYGLLPYSGAVTKDALINEVLNQRRFSLFWEGHRWFDMRRRGRLAQITPQGTIGNQTFVVFEAMARPDAEVQWDRQNP